MSRFRPFNLLPSFQRQPKQRRPNRNPLRAVEALEERRMLAVLTVTDAGPSGPGTLADAIAMANDPVANPGHDIIRFAPNVRGELVVDETLVITDDLTIQGPGAHRLTVSGDDQVRVFSVEPSDLAAPISVEIQRIEIANGLATSAPLFPPVFAFGGGVYNLGSHVTLDGVRMTGNHAAGAIAAGGAVANEFGGTLTVRGSWFSDNGTTGFVIGAGGAITSDIGPTGDGEGTPGPAVLDISHSTFADNTAASQVADPALAGDFAPFAGFAFGGAISSLATEATIAHSRFVGNSVLGGQGQSGSAGGFANGGAIYADDFSPFDATPPVLGRDSSLDVSHSYFSDNTATGGTGDVGERGGVGAGGAISVSIAFLPDTADIRFSSFSNNTAVGGEGGDGGAGGDSMGGALSVLAGADVSVANSRFFRNAARGGMGSSGGDGGNGTGGAIGLGRIVTAVPTPFEALIPSIIVHNSSMRSNQAVGGLAGHGADGGDGNGGAVGITRGATASISRSMLFRNHARGGGGGVGGDGGNGQGGAVFNSGSDASLARSIVFRNIASAGDAGAGGLDGLGLGGGLFNEDDDEFAGVFDIDRLSRLLTRFNSADDAGDNLFGDFS